MKPWQRLAVAKLMATARQGRNGCVARIRLEVCRYDPFEVWLGRPYALGALCPHIPKEIQRTYAALGSSCAIDYFKSLGIAALELLPIHQFVDDKILVDLGLRNDCRY
jgi:hypothetical protein